jgi:uncharacterized protein (TIGR02271 family)
MEGRRGVARDMGDPSRVEVALDDGERLFVPRTMVTERRDHTWRFGHAFSAVAERPTATGPLVVPVVEERVAVDKRTVERERVSLNTRVSQREEMIDIPLTEEELRVERVEVGRLVDRPEAPREIGDTLVVPVYEEVVVVEKRLLLREELHVTRVRHERHERRPFVLRREDVDVERTPLRPAGR